jgi:hypothetical protein
MPENRCWRAIAPISPGKTNSWALFAIGNRKSKIAIVIVPVVQRIEQGFLKGKTASLQESPNDIRSSQLAVFEVLD